MKTLYLDCFSGVSGNMLLGAFLDAGYSQEHLRSVISDLGFDPDILHVERVQKSGISSVLVTVDLPPNQPHRHLPDIEAIIDHGNLPLEVSADAKAVFTNLAKAEALVHGTTINQIHFHEVGAVDAIIDIVGVCSAVHALDVEQVICSPLPLGRGTVKCAHGEIPVPVPATVALLKGIPTYSANREGEHVTPTGAALVSTLADRFEPRINLTMEAIGYGAGTRTYSPGPPNMLRAMIGQSDSVSSRDDLVVEANIDDMNPEMYGVLSDKLFQAGALDVVLTPCYMKKGRPGTLITIICGQETLDDVAKTLFAHSTTIGFRYYQVSRIVCERSIEEVRTPYGAVNVKVSRHLGEVVGTKPEFDKCRQLAEKEGVSVQTVIDAARCEYLKKD